MSRIATIKLSINLDDADLPTYIEWQASEGSDDGPAVSQAVMLSLWDSENQTTAAIDLWTREMTVEDMNLYFYQALHKMAETYERATNNKDLAATIHHFSEEFGEGAGVIERDSGLRVEVAPTARQPDLTGCPRSMK